MELKGLLRNRSEALKLFQISSRWFKHNRAFVIRHVRIVYKIVCPLPPAEIAAVSVIICITVAGNRVNGTFLSALW